MKHIRSFLVLSLLLLSNTFLLEAATSVWNGKTIATSFYSGTGTKSNPYTIYTASQFAYFYQEMANGRTFEGQYISLKNDIDMTQTYLSYMVGIENSSFSFYGNFNGEDHSLAAVPGNNARIFGDLYGTVYNVVFAKYATMPATILTGGEMYNCKFEVSKMGCIWLNGGTVANCYCSYSVRWQNGSKYGGAYGFCDGSGYCYNCTFTGMEYISYGGSTASNYGGYTVTGENNGVSDAEHNQWVNSHVSSARAYKLWPLTFSPSYPSYTVKVSFVDASSMTNYATVDRTAGTCYTLPAPSGFQSEFLGWDIDGEVVKTYTPNDETLCSAQWNHKYVTQPTFLNPTAMPQDKAKATTQWYRLAAKDVKLANDVTAFEVETDNATLEFDYSVWSSSGGYSTDGYSGYLSIDGVVIVSCSWGDDADGHYKATMSKGRHTISRSHATTKNIVLGFIPTPVGSVNTYQLELSNIAPTNGCFYCETTYGTNKLYSDTIDTSDLFLADELLLVPTSESKAALLKAATSTMTSLVPQTVVNNNVEYTITSLSDYAFAGGSSLQRIICMQTVPLTISTSAVSSVFQGINKSTCRLLVPTSSVSKYQAATGWKDFTTIKSSSVVPAKIYLGNSTAISKNTEVDELLEQDVTDNGLVFIDDQDVDQTLPANFVKKDNSNQWIASGIELTDAMPLYSPADLQAEQISYSRNFTNTSWQAWYVPFDMPYEDIEDKAQVAYINNVHQYDDNDDGVIDRTILEFISVKNGVIDGNTPYVVKPFETGEVTFETSDAVFMATEDSAVECQSTRTRYIISGNYQPKDDMYSNGAYALSQGSWKQTSDPDAVLQPFRISMVIVSKNAAHQANAPKRIEMTVDGQADDEISGLFDLYMQDEESGDIYNINGQTVAAPTHGIYIRNGKKYMQK